MDETLSWIRPELEALDKAPSDLLLVSAFQEELPLRGLSALIDWRLCTKLSSWRLGGFSTGQLGEQILYPSQRRLAQKSLLFVSLGKPSLYRSDLAFALLESLVESLKSLNIRHLTTDLLGFNELSIPLHRNAKAFLKPLSSFESLTLVAHDEERQKLERGLNFF